LHFSSDLSFKLFGLLGYFDVLRALSTVLRLGWNFIVNETAKQGDDEDEGGTA